jgi:predicted nucleotidyltransferase
MSAPRPPATPLAEAFERAIDALTEARAEYALIGGFAVAHHGLPRPTRDVDILLRVPRVSLPALLDGFRARGFEFDARRVLEELRDDRLSSVNYRGVRVDLLEAVIPLFARAVERASAVEIRGRPVRVVRAEELVAMKLVAAREDDLRDVRGILAAQAGAIDLAAVRDSLEECAGAPTLELLERLAAAAREGGAPGGRSA